MNLCVALNSEAKALGWWVIVAKMAQSYWKYNKGLIPESAYKFKKIPPQLVQSGMVKKMENGYYLHGSERNFAWIISKVENGRKGGRSFKPTEMIDKHSKLKVSAEKAMSKPQSQSQSHIKKEKEKKPDGFENPDKIIHKQILDYLNSLSGKKYRASTATTVRAIQARLSEEYTLGDFKQVIDNQTRDWKNTEYEKFLRPSTLFGNKFENYLNNSMQESQSEQVATLLGDSTSEDLPDWIEKAVVKNEN